MRKVEDPILQKILYDLQNQIDKLSKAVNRTPESDGSVFDGKKGDLRFVEGADKRGYMEFKGKNGVYSSVRGMFEVMGRERPDPRFERLYVDNLFASSFTARQINAINGDFIASDFAVVEAVADNVVTFVNQDKMDLCPFVADDVIATRHVEIDNSADIRYVKATVDSVSGRDITVTYSGSDKFRAGDTVIRFGNTSDATRQDYIGIFTNPTNSPYIDVVDGVDAVADIDTITPKVRIGYLAGITDADFGGALSGYGIYTQSGYFKGDVYGSNFIAGAVKSSSTMTYDRGVAGTEFGYWLGEYGTNDYRLYIGSSTLKNFVYDDTNFELTGGNVVAGALKSTSAMTYDKGIAGTSDGYWIGRYSSGVYKMFIGSLQTKYFAYDNTDVILKGGNVISGAVKSSSTMTYDRGIAGTEGGYHLGIYPDLLTGVTTNITTNIFTKTSHGLVNNDRVTLSAIVDTTNIDTTTVYYVVGVSGSDFQVSLTLGGAAVDLQTSNGTCSVQKEDYRLFIGSSASKYLSYDSSDLALVGGTITGGTIQTATSGQRVVVSGAGNSVIFYNSSGDPVTLAGSSNGLDFSNTIGVVAYTLSLYGGGNFRFHAQVGATPYEDWLLWDYSSGELTWENGFTADSINLGASKFIVDSSGRITKVNNTTATSGYALIGDGTSFTPTDLFGGTNTWTGANTFQGDFTTTDDIIVTQEGMTFAATIDMTGKSYVNAGGSGSTTTNTINGGTTGKIIYLENASSSFTWTIGHMTGNVRLNGGANYAMGQYDTLTLIYNGTYWLELARSNNA